jgi:ADP-ribose pyrophosphatase YjhB (NUDIX family)
VLQRKPRSGKAWFPAGNVYLPDEEHVDAVVRDLFEKTGLTMTVDDLALWSEALVRVSLLGAKLHHVYVYSAYVRVPYVDTFVHHLRSCKL